MLMINICDKVLNKICSVCWGYRIQCEDLLTFINSGDPDEMQHHAAFHLGLHSLQKYSLRSFPNRKG